MALSMDDYPELFTVNASVFQVPAHAIPLTSLGISVYLIHITQDIAEFWLKHKNINRTVHLSVLNKLKRSLEQGIWEINGETIIFDDEGRLIEGQHRLQAVVDTGIPIWSLVVHGIDKDRFKTMGQGSKRTAGDILSIRGEKNARNLAAALRWVWRYENNQMLNPHPAITEYELADTIEKHEAITRSLTYGAQMKHGLIAPGLITALHYLCAKKNQALANDFFWSFATGLGLEIGNPVYVLRDVLAKRAKARQIMRDERKAPLVINAWNVLRKNPEEKLGNARRLFWRDKVGQVYPKIN
jgi:hypothetical protein